MDSKQVIALGFFDGVHRGHGMLLKACRALADEIGCDAGALTFSVHPDALVSGAAPALINTPADREKLMREMFGIQQITVLQFDHAMMHTPWQDFFRMLLEDYRAAGLVCGHDFRFGDRGAGNASLLKSACEEAEIPCIIVPEQKLDGITVSSTYIRTLLERGDAERAAMFLGHPHILTGEVIHGRHLGSTLGIPTANLRLPEGIIEPAHGVYACLACLGDRKYPAVTNVGSRPTVGGHRVTVEPWILDFEGDLYGSVITLEFHKFLRPEVRFPSLDALQAEIRRNAEQTRHYFGESSHISPEK